MKNSYVYAATCILMFGLSAETVQSQERREIPEYREFGEPASESDRRALQSFLQQFTSAWHDQDTQRLVKLHAEDTEWINAYARMFRGRDALGRFLEERLFPAFDVSVSRGEADNMHLISIRYVGERVAIFHMYTDGNRGASRNTGEQSRRTHIHLVVEKQSENWQIVHTAIMDAR